MNAYELADELTIWSDLYRAYYPKERSMAGEASDMLRQQADRITELEKDLHMVQRHYDQLTPQTKPRLSDEEIDRIIYSVDWAYDPVILARAIEERHGIK